MGQRGPKPEPTASKRARGNPGKRSLTEDVQFAEGAPEMPQHLDREARKIWRELLPVLMSVRGLLTIGDGIVLGNLCEVRSRRLAIARAIRERELRAARELVAAAKKKGMKLTARQVSVAASEASIVMKTPSGYMQQHPLVGMLNAALDQENKLCRELGLTPSARSGMKLTGSMAPSIDPIEAAISQLPPGETARVQ